VSQTSNPLPWIFALIAGGILLIGVTTYLMINKSPQNNTIDANTVEVQEKTLTVNVSASGRVQPIDSVNISPTNPGRIAKLLVDQGAIVKAGDPLAIIENQEEYADGVQAESIVLQAQASLQEAQIRLQGEIKVLEAQLAQAVARYEEAKQRITAQVEQIKSQLAQAELNVKLAESQVKRNEILIKEGAISQDQFDKIMKEYLSYQANFQEIVHRLEELNNTGQVELQRLEVAAAEVKISLEEKKLSSGLEIQRLKAVVQEKQAGLEKTKIRFKETYLQAPFDGIITQKFASEGAFVTPTTSASSSASATSTSIFALAKGLEIVAKVPEIDITKIKYKQPANIVADAYPDSTFKGVVTKIAPEAIIEQNVTSFEVTISLATGLDKLLSQMNVDVTFLGEPITNALMVPTVAIVTQNGQTGVMIPDSNNQPEFKQVKLGVTVGNETQILEGLLPDDKVFINLP
jgi:HlyD family secretion protein